MMFCRLLVLAASVSESSLSFGSVLLLVRRRYISPCLSLARERAAIQMAVPPSFTLPI